MASSNTNESTNPNQQRPARDQVLSILDDLDSLAAPKITKQQQQQPDSTSKPDAQPPTSSSKLSKPKLASTNSTSSVPKQSSNNTPKKAEEAQSVLDFLDEITQRSSTPTPSISTKKLNSSSSRPLSRKPSNSSISGNKPRASIDQTNNSNSDQNVNNKNPQTESTAATTSSGWGWGSVLKQATSNVLSQVQSAAGQVQSVVADHSKSNELVKSLNSNIQNQISNPTEAAMKWKEGVLNYVKASGIDQLGKDLQATGLKSLHEIINMVAPPISKHELIEVQLSYDMVGYDGVETLVYQTLSKIMEQVDGGDLILNKGDEEKLKVNENQGEGELERDLNSIEGLTEGYKLALANLEQMIQRHSKKSLATAVNNESSPSEEKTSGDKSNGDGNESTNVPITHCPIYIRIQPILSRLPVFTQSATNQAELKNSKDRDDSRDGDGQKNKIRSIKVDQESHLFFLILLRDVNNELDHATLTQSIPASWLEIPFEENEWVEDIMVDVIRKGVETIGQQYVNGRLSGRSIRNAKVENSKDEKEKNVGDVNESDGKEKEDK